MVIAHIFRSPNVDPKILVTLVKPAEDLMQCTKAVTCILIEIHFAMKDKKKLHKCFTDSGLDIAECMKTDGLEGNPKER